MVHALSNHSLHTTMTANTLVNYNLIFKKIQINTLTEIITCSLFSCNRLC
jgi:hypothetical protein